MSYLFLSCTEKVVSKEQKRLQLIEENEEHQTIIVRVLVI